MLTVFTAFFTVGLFTFGGGLAMLPLIAEHCTKNGWLTMEELTNFVAVSESTPGPFAINIATYVGAQSYGFWGALAATVGVILPSFVIILLVARFYLRFRRSRVVGGMLYGLRAAVVGLLAAALWSMLPSVFWTTGAPTAEFFCFIVIFCAALLAVWKKTGPIPVLLGSAALGIAAGLLFF